MSSNPRLTVILSIALVAACGDDGGDTKADACDPTLRPVVMAHGFLAAGDTWSLQAQRFEANGVCPTHLVAFDWNTLSPDGAEGALDQVIDRVLAATGATQVDLVGHSAGGGLGYRYLSDGTRAAKVARYVHVASNPAPLDGVDPGPAGPAGAPVPTLALRSTGDTIVQSQADIPGATNVVLTAEDHYQVATSARAFEAMWQHLHDGPPETTSARAAARPTLAGKALTLGENVPVAGWTVDVWALDATTGRRAGASPEATFTVASDGAWGPFEAVAGARYELHLRGSAATDRPVHYYMEPPTSHDRLVYLRALPGPDSLVGILLSQLPFDDRHTVLIAFSGSSAVVSGRNTLTVGERTLSTPELASAERTTIAFFVFDEGVDQTSAGEATTFAGLLTAFLAAVDEHVAASASESITVTLDGRGLAVPRWPSATEGATVVVFR
ncbi:MAG: hypothetical protein IT385_25290 [Deltaproteobacteria bacterium]|nr:hypothetical protein [Deltaproteobacteria bacterium]